MASPGKSLGPYELVALVGAGGMGEVWRARDPRLNREVAVKLLPGTFSADPERLRRFEQEARAAAALNHPHIIVVYDIGAQNGVPYIVTELLQGESLRDCLRTGGLPLRKVSEYGAQIARALAAAHAHGIVHRDLKPENVFLTREGQVKVLDFGLAKLIERAEPGTAAATMTGQTTPGLVLGTVGYMSPEQVRGRDVDHRSDIFSLGAILYEMVSGRRAFHGDTTADTLSSILKEDPPELSATNRAVSPAVDRIVRHCLEKAPEQRFQSAGDIAFDLEALSSPSVATSSMPAVAGPATRKKLWQACAGVLVLAAIAGAFLAGRGLRSSAMPRLTRATFRNGTILSARYSPDGHTAYYTAAWSEDPPEIFSVSENGPAAQSTGVRNADIVAAMRSGELLVLTNITSISGRNTTQGTLAEVPVSGGAPKPLLDHIVSADATPDGNAFAIVRFIPDGRQFQLEYPVGTVLYRSSGYMNSLRISADGNRVAFLDHPVMGDDRGRVALVDRKGVYTKVSEDLETVVGLAWAPSGELWFGSGVGIVAAKPGGAQRTVYESTTRLAVEDLNPQGRLLVRSSTYRFGLAALAPGADKERDISWLDWPVPRDISPDGKRVLFTEQGSGGYSVYLGFTDGSPAVRLGKGDGWTISPDGQWVAAATLSQTPQIVLLPTGAGEPRQITHDNINHSNCGWFPDGDRLLCTGSEVGHGIRSYAVDVATGNTTALTPEGTAGLRISPDRRYLLLGGAGGARLWQLPNGPAQPVRGLTPGVGILRFLADGKLLVTRSDGNTRHMSILDPLTGEQKPLRDFVDPAIAGYRVLNGVFTPDGRGYVYRYSLQFDDLYTLDGLR